LSVIGIIVRGINYSSRGFYENLCLAMACCSTFRNSAFRCSSQNDASIPFRQRVSQTFHSQLNSLCNANMFSRRYPPKYAGSSEFIVTCIPISRNNGIGECAIDGTHCNLTFDSGQTVSGIFRRANSLHSSRSSIARIPWSTRWTLRWSITVRIYAGGPFGILLTASWFAIPLCRIRRSGGGHDV